MSTKLKEAKKGKGATIPEKDQHWWLANKDTDLLERLTFQFAICYGANQPRGRAYGNYWSMYASPSNQVNALGGGQADTLATTGIQSTERRLSIPLCQSVIDTQSSLLADDRPRPFFCTSGGTVKSQDYAKKLQAFGDAAIYETDLYAKAMLAFKDCGIYGDGFLHPFKDQNKRLACEVVPPSEICISPDEARSDDPRTLYRWKNMDKDVLVALYPDAKDDILDAYAKMAGMNPSTTRRFMSNRIRVIFAWHLPSTSMEKTDAKKGEKIDGEEVQGPETDGRMTIFIPDHCIVEDKPWCRHEFPFAKLSYNPVSDSYWGMGIPQSLGTMQADINTMMRRIQRAMHLMSNPHLISYRGSQLQFGSLNSGMATEIRVAAPGLEPKAVNWEAMGPEVYQHVETEIERFFQFSGVSQMAATSQKPAGLNSGAAIRTYNDMGSQRFQALGKRFEAFFIQIMKLFIAEAIEIAKESDSYPVKYVSRRAKKMTGSKIEEFDFKKLDLDTMDYWIEVSAVDSLSNDVAGRIQMVTEMAQSGAPVDPQQLYSLLELPDTPAFFKRMFASRELVEKMVYSILYDGKYVSPNPYLDIPYAQQYATQEMAEAQLADDVPEARLEMLQNWLDAVVQIKQAATDAAIAQQAAQHPPIPQNVGPQPVQQPVKPGPQGAK